MQSLLQGLPLAAQQYTYAQPSVLSELLSGSGGIMDIFNSLFELGGDKKSTEEERSEAAEIMGYGDV